jgi:hypothetical protein
VWEALRLAAGSWQQRAAGVTEQVSDSQLAQIGREALSKAGIGIAQVNTYRGLAGSWLAAKTQLHALDEDQQIPAGAIFTPPWAITTANGVEPRYRARVNWAVEAPDGEQFEKWSTYEVDAPLTTLGDLLGEAEDAAEDYVDSDQVYAASGLSVLDFELERV